MKQLFLGMLIIALCMGNAFAVLKTPRNGHAKDACVFSGGEWFGSEDMHWSCCWAEWGCLQCTTRTSCELICENAQCITANNQSEPKIQAGYTAIKGLVPAELNPPVVPVSPKAMKVIPLQPVRVK